MTAVVTIGLKLLLINQQVVPKIHNNVITVVDILLMVICLVVIVMHQNVKSFKNHKILFVIIKGDRSDYDN